LIRHPEFAKSTFYAKEGIGCPASLHGVHNTEIIRRIAFEV